MSISFKLAALEEILRVAKSPVAGRTSVVSAMGVRTRYSDGATETTELTIAVTSTPGGIILQEPTPVGPTRIT